MTAPLTVDVTGWWIARLNASTVGARAASETPGGEPPNDLASQLPFVQVVRAGGPNDGVILDVPTMVFHCFAGTQQAANVLAYSVGALARSLVGVVADGAVVTEVRTLSGPLRADAVNPAVRQAVLTLQPRIKITT